jgi:hypothetical protein
MVIGIAAAALGALIAAAMIVIPRYVNRHSDPYNDADALAYEHKTGRSTTEIEEENAAGTERQQNGPQQGGGSDG